MPELICFFYRWIIAAAIITNEPGSAIGQKTPLALRKHSSLDCSTASLLGNGGYAWMR